MPYLITTRVDVHGDELSVDVQSRRAVATLEEARDEIRAMLRGKLLSADDSRVEGILCGTVGPLPDGTVIEVERVTWDELAESDVLACRPDDPGAGTDAELIDAYNAAQGT